MGIRANVRIGEEPSLRDKGNWWRNELSKLHRPVRSSSACLLAGLIHASLLNNWNIKQMPDLWRDRKRPFDNASQERNPPTSDQEREEYAPKFPSCPALRKLQTEGRIDTFCWYLIGPHAQPNCLFLSAPSCGLKICWIHCQWNVWCAEVGNPKECHRRATFWCAECSRRTPFQCWEEWGRVLDNTLYRPKRIMESVSWNSRRSKSLKTVVCGVIKTHQEPDWRRWPEVQPGLQAQVSNPVARCRGRLRTSCW